MTFTYEDLDLLYEGPEYDGVGTTAPYDTGLPYDTDDALYGGTGETLTYDDPCLVYDGALYDGCTFGEALSVLVTDALGITDLVEGELAVRLAEVAALLDGASVAPAAVTTDGVALGDGASVAPAAVTTDGVALGDGQTWDAGVVVLDPLTIQSWVDVAGKLYLFLVDSMGLSDGAAASAVARALSTVDLGDEPSAGPGAVTTDGVGLIDASVPTIGVTFTDDLDLDDAVRARFKLAEFMDCACVDIAAATAADFIAAATGTTTVAGASAATSWTWATSTIEWTTADAGLSFEECPCQP